MSYSSASWHALCFNCIWLIWFVCTRDRPGADQACLHLQSSNHFLSCSRTPQMKLHLAGLMRTAPEGAHTHWKIRMSKRGCQCFPSNPSHWANSLDHFTFSSLAKVNNPHSGWRLECWRGIMWEPESPWLLLLIVPYFGSRCSQRVAKGLQTGVWFMYTTLLT